MRARAVGKKISSYITKLVLLTLIRCLVFYLVDSFTHYLLNNQVLPSCEFIIPFIAAFNSYLL